MTKEVTTKPPSCPYRSLFLLSITPHFREHGGGWEDIVVYSYLVLRLTNKRGQSASIRAIASYTRLCPETVRASRDRLLAMKLIRSDDGKLMANEPTDQQRTWFHWRKHREEYPWFKRMAYYRWLIPAKESGLPSRYACVYCLLWSWARYGRYLGHGITKSTLAKQMLVGRDTIARAVLHLRKQGMLDEQMRPGKAPEKCDGLWITKRMRIKLPPVESQDHHWFSKAMKKHLADVHFRFFHPQERFFYCLEMDENRLHRCGYSAVEIRDYFWAVATALDYDVPLIEFFLLKASDVLFKKAEERTAFNRAAGTFDGPNSFGLLKGMSVEFAKLVRKRVAAEGLGILTGWTIEPDKL